jgi:hypothetical protein
MLEYMMDCRDCGAINLDTISNCELCNAVLQKRLVYTTGYIVCNECGTKQVKPNLCGKKCCTSCKSNFLTNPDKRHRVFHVGQAVYFMVNAGGFVKPGNVISIEPSGDAVKIQHAEKAWSKEKYNEVHPVSEVAETCGKCCELVGVERRSSSRLAHI